MPPKAKRDPRRRKMCSDDSLTQRLLSFDPPSKDPLQHRGKLVDKLESVRLNMLRLQQEEQKYLRQLLRNELANKHADQARETPIDTEEPIRYTLWAPDDADPVDVCLGKYAQIREEEANAHPTQPEEPETETLQPSYLKDFEPEFLRALQQIEGLGVAASPNK